MGVINIKLIIWIPWLILFATITIALNINLYHLGVIPAFIYAIFFYVGGVLISVLFKKIRKNSFFYFFVPLCFIIMAVGIVYIKGNETDSYVPNELKNGSDYILVLPNEAG